MDKELAGFGWYIKRIDNALAREACRNVQSHNLTMQQSHLLFVLSDAENHTRTLKELVPCTVTPLGAVFRYIRKIKFRGAGTAYPFPSRAPTERR